MSKHIDNPIEAANYDAVSLGYIARELDVSRTEARRIVRQMHEAVWLDAPVVKSTAGALPEAEDGIHKYGYYVDQVGR